MSKSKVTKCLVAKEKAKQYTNTPLMSSYYNPNDISQSLLPPKFLKNWPVTPTQSNGSKFGVNASIVMSFPIILAKAFFPFLFYKLLTTAKLSR
jgi:hypothetical protein